MILNFVGPIVVLVNSCMVGSKFSGIPFKNAYFQHKIKMLRIAVFIWTIARTIRAITGTFEGKVYEQVIKEVKDQ